MTSKRKQLESALFDKVADLLPLVVLDKTVSAMQCYYFLNGNAERFLSRYGKEERLQRYRTVAIFSDDGANYVKDILENEMPTQKTMKRLFYRHTLIVPLSERHALHFSSNAQVVRDVVVDTSYSAKAVYDQFALIRKITDCTTLPYDMREKQKQSSSVDLVISFVKNEQDAAVSFEYNGLVETFSVDEKKIRLLFPFTTTESSGARYFSLTSHSLFYHLLL